MNRLESIKIAPDRTKSHKVGLTGPISNQYLED